MKRYYFIDSIKGIGISGIVAVHSLLYFGAHLPEPVKNVIGIGAQMVQIFFIISAFSLMLSTQSLRKNNNFSLKLYLIKRLSRIIPLYYLSLTLYLIFRFQKNNNLDTIINIFTHITFTNGFSPYYINSIIPGSWFIATLMLIYFIFPIIRKFISNISYAIIFTISSITINEFILKMFHITGILPVNEMWINYFGQYFFSQLPFFGIGIILYFLYSDFFHNKKRNKKFLVYSIIIITYFAFFFLRDILRHSYQNGILITLIILVLSEINFILIKMNFINLLGKYSYGIYLFHFAIMDILNKFTVKIFVFTGITNLFYLLYSIELLIVLILSLIVSTLLNQLFEKPIQNFIVNYFKQKTIHKGLNASRNRR